MSKPSYLGLLNAIAVAEARGEELFQGLLLGLLNGFFLHLVEMGTGTRLSRH